MYLRYLYIYTYLTDHIYRLPVALSTLEQSFLEHELSSVSFFVHPHGKGTREDLGCKLPELFILWSGIHPRSSVLSSLRLNQGSASSGVRSLAFSKAAFPWPPVRALALAASLRAWSCTRRSPPPRRTIRIPISLPAFLSLYGRVRYSCSVRWITCARVKGRKGIRDWQCRRYCSSSVSLRRQRRVIALRMCENPTGLSLQVCEFFHSQTDCGLRFGSS